MIEIYVCILHLKKVPSRMSLKHMKAWTVDFHNWIMSYKRHVHACVNLDSRAIYVFFLARQLHLAWYWHGL
jgi:hypothetical protein